MRRNFAKCHAIALVCFLIAFWSGGAVAQSSFDESHIPLPTVDEIIQAGDSSMVRNAERLQRGLARRIWTYVDDDGKSRTFEGAFQSTYSTRGKVWGAFTNRIRIEIERLSAKDQKWIEAVEDYQLHVERDAKTLQRQMIIAREQERKQAIAREQAATEEDRRRDPPITVADVLANVNAAVILDGQPRDLLVKRGEVVVVLDIQGGL